MAPKTKKTAKPAKKVRVEVHMPKEVRRKTNDSIKALLNKSFGAKPLPEASGLAGHILQFQNTPKKIVK